MTDCTTSIVYNQYVVIIKYNKERYKQLSKQLKKWGITNVSNLSFTELINQIDDISAIETYYEYNEKPLDDPRFYETPNVSDFDVEFNVELAKQLNYYMRLLGYYLILKGVDADAVNQATDLETRILLLNFIKGYQSSSLTVTTDKKFQYLVPTNIPYNLRDLNGNKITSGTLYLKRNNKIIKTIEAGEPINITPTTVGTIEYELEYEGYAQYSPITTTFVINTSKGTPEIDTNIYTGIDNIEQYDIILTKDSEIEQLGQTITLTATAIEPDGVYGVNGVPITFTANGEIINTVSTNIYGQAETTYTITNNEDVIVRAYSSNQVSNYIRIELMSYFNALKERLTYAEHVYTHLYENTEGTIVGITKDVSEIQSVNDLNGVIYGMYVQDDNWGYKRFNSDRIYITNEEFNELMTILVDYEDNGNDITITTLGDIYG